MIRIKCPKCGKKLRIDDAQAGKVGTCPECGQKFRIPNKVVRVDEPSASARRRAEAQKAAAAPSVKQSPARPNYEWEDNDSSPYTVIKEAEQPPPKEVRLVNYDAGGEDLDAEEFGLDQEYLKQKKEKKRKVAEAELVPGLTISNAILIGLAVIWLALAALTFLKPQSFVILWFLGSLVNFAAGIWFLVIAFMDDGPVIGICCIFIPFYSLYYLCTHWDRTGKTFRIGLMGVIMILTGISIAQYKGTIDLREGVPWPAKAK